MRNRDTFKRQQRPQWPFDSRTLSLSLSLSLSLLLSIYPVYVRGRYYIRYGRSNHLKVQIYLLSIEAVSSYRCTKQPTSQPTNQLPATIR